ncbi:hypothetical protein V8324_01000 [Roseovarius sp. D22-M7]
MPDAFVSVRAARAGRGITSLAKVLGSNVFDLQGIVAELRPEV